MSEADFERKLQQDSFEVKLDINVDIRLNKGYVNIGYLKYPQNQKFMCASVIFWYATRILWLAQSTENYEMLELFDRYFDLSNSMELVLNPMNNKLVKLYSIGTPNNFNFNLDYEGYALGGMFARDIPEVTLYSFFALHKYFTQHILPKNENIDFYNGMNNMINAFMNTDLRNAEPTSVRRLIMGCSVELAFKKMGFKYNG